MVSFTLLLILYSDLNCISIVFYFFFSHPIFLSLSLSLSLSHTLYYPIVSTSFSLSLSVSISLPLTLSVFFAIFSVLVLLVINSRLPINLLILLSCIYLITFYLSHLTARLWTCSCFCCCCLSGCLSSYLCCQRHRDDINRIQKELNVEQKLEEMDGKMDDWLGWY